MKKQILKIQPNNNISKRSKKREQTINTQKRDKTKNPTEKKERQEEKKLSVLCTRPSSTFALVIGNAWIFSSIYFAHSHTFQRANGSINVQ